MGGEKKQDMQTRECIERSRLGGERKREEKSQSSSNLVFDVTCDVFAREESLSSAHKAWEIELYLLVGGVSVNPWVPYLLKHQ